MADKFTQTRPVTGQDALDTVRLAAWMTANVEGFFGTLQVEKFKGGQSNPTYRLTAGGRRYVLRRKPPGKLLPSAHAVDREYRVMSALREWLATGEHEDAAYLEVPAPLEKAS